MGQGGRGIRKRRVDVVVRRLGAAGIDVEPDAIEDLGQRDLTFVVDAQDFLNERSREVQIEGRYHAAF